MPIGAHVEEYLIPIKSFDLVNDRHPKAASQLTNKIFRETDSIPHEMSWYYMIYRNDVRMTKGDIIDYAKQVAQHYRDDLVPNPPASLIYFAVTEGMTARLKVTGGTFLAEGDQDLKINDKEPPEIVEAVRELCGSSIAQTGVFSEMAAEEGAEAQSTGTSLLDDLWAGFSGGGSPPPAPAPDNPDNQGGKP